MPSFTAILKTEITRLARKEIRGEIEPLKKANAGYRRDIAALKRQVRDLEREIGRNAKAKSPAVAKPQEKPAGITSKGLKSLRAKLGLSAADFGRLIDASAQSVYNWESGKAAPRRPQVAAIVAVRAIGKREAAARLASASG